MGKTLRYKKLELGEYCIPEEAIRLIEDIKSLRQILDLLNTLDTRSLSDMSGEGWKIKRRLLRVIAAWETYAETKLQRRFLGGKPIKPRAHAQRLRDVAKLFLNQH